jgi:ATP-dependent Clp protease ATP-binding subunit ClpC
VGTEHILLALLGQDEGTAAEVLKSSGASYVRVRAAVIGMMGLGADPDAHAREPTFTGQAQDAIENAEQAASRRGQNQVGTEDILLALVEERDGASVRILQQLDADPAAIRSALAS